MIIRNIVRSATEPDINSLWLKNGTLMQYINGEWVAVTPNGDIQETKEQVEKLTDQVKSLNKEVYGIWDDVSEIKEVLAAIQSNELDELLKKLDYTDEDIEIFKHLYLTAGIDVTLDDIKYAAEVWQNRDEIISEYMDNSILVSGALVKNRRPIRILPKFTETTVLDCPSALFYEGVLDYDAIIDLFNISDPGVYSIAFSSEVKYIPYYYSKSGSFRQTSEDIVHTIGICRLESYSTETHYTTPLPIRAAYRLEIGTVTVQNLNLKKLVWVKELIFNGPVNLHLGGGYIGSSFNNYIFRTPQNVSFENVQECQYVFSTEQDDIKDYLPKAIKGSWDISKTSASYNAFWRRSLLPGTYIKAKTGVTILPDSAILGPVTIDLTSNYGANYPDVGTVLSKCELGQSSELCITLNFLEATSFKVGDTKTNDCPQVYASIPTVKTITVLPSQEDPFFIWLADISKNVQSTIPVYIATGDKWFTRDMFMSYFKTWATQSDPKVIQFSTFQFEQLTDLDKATITEKGYTITTVEDE